MSVYYDKIRNRWRLDLRYDGYRLVATNTDNQILERMQSIVVSSKMPYDKAKLLVTDYKHGLIPPGYIGHKYFCSDAGYRILTMYSNGDGCICKYYDSPEGAWNDPRIQSGLKTAGVKQYSDYLSTVNSDKPWHISIYTILRCRITPNGRILTIK